MSETFQLALELKCEFSNFYSMMAYPGSELYNYAKSKGWYLPKNMIEYSQYAYECNPIQTNHFSLIIFLE